MRRLAGFLLGIVLGSGCWQAPDGSTSGGSRSRLPRAEDLQSLLIRTDFTNDAAWARLNAALAAPAEYHAFLELVEDRRYEALTIGSLLELAAGDSAHPFVFLADQITLSSAEQPVLVVDLLHQPGRYFRVIPSELWAVQNNLIIANADWEDFSELADPDGVFRGLRR